MSQPAPKPLSPEWWRDRLYVKLCARADWMRRMDAYYSGDHPLPFLTKAHNAKMRDEFRQLLEDSKANFMRLVVEAVDERLVVEGFRLSADTDPTADQATWKNIWQANQMDAQSSTAFSEALVKGVSYLSVWEGDNGPTIAVEDPTETIVAYTPGSNYMRRDAAVKVWLDDVNGVRRANVYLPAAIYKYQARVDDVTAGTVEQPAWKPLPGNDAEVHNPVGIVPIVPLRNRPRLGCEGESELSDVYRIQNQINGFLFLLALGGYFGAHKQRWAVGLTIMEDKTTGKPVEPFDVDVGKLWVATQGDNGQQVQFGEFSQTDLSGYIKSIDQKVQHLAVITRMPKHYLLPTGQEPSGDAISSAETALVKKAKKKQTSFGEGVEEAMRLARLFGGESTPPDGEVVWADPKTESIAAVTDAVIKQYEAGLIPWEAALETLGRTPTEIARFSAMRMTDALVKGLTNPQPEHPVKVEPPLVIA